MSDRRFRSLVISMMYDCRKCCTWLVEIGLILCFVIWRYVREINFNENATTRAFRWKNLLIIFLILKMSFLRVREF